MSQNVPAQQATPETPIKKSRFKFVMILFAILLVFGGGLGGAYWFFTKDGVDPIKAMISSIFGEKEEVVVQEGKEKVTNRESSSSRTSQVSDPKNGQGSPTNSYSLPPLTINLADTGVTRYLRIGIDLELSTKEALAQVEAQSARIRDAIIILLSGKTYSSLASADGKFQLKNEIISRINQILGLPRVVQIYFTDFVVQ